MDGICGVFRPDLIPDWISKIGPGVAALIAVALYGLGRWHASRDLAAKRKILHRMLRQQVLLTIEQCTVLDDIIEKIAVAEGYEAVVKSSRLPTAQRLFELQPQLLSIGAKGDFAIASFIEACRAYESWVSNLESHVSGNSTHRVECLQGNAGSCRACVGSAH